MLKHNGKALESGGVQGEREAEKDYTREDILNCMPSCITHCIGTVFISCLDLTGISVFGTIYRKILCPHLLFLPVQKLDLGALTPSANVFHNVFGDSLPVLSGYFFYTIKKLDFWSTLVSSLFWLKKG
jgi:hypothetical protein